MLVEHDNWCLLKEHFQQISHYFKTLFKIAEHHNYGLVLLKKCLFYRNPNQPVALPNGIPEWPQFDTDSSKFIELNSNSTKVITTPHMERLESVLEDIFTARSAQVLADNLPGM